MSQYRVQTIEEQTKQTRKAITKNPKAMVKVSKADLVAYCDKVLYLCREIRKLNHYR